MRSLIPLLLLASQAFGAIAYVQGNSVVEGGSAGTIALAFGANNTANNVIAVGAACNSNSVTASATDSQGNTYTQLIQETSGAVTLRGWIFWAKVTSSAANTVTVTFSASCDFRNLAILEYSGVDNVSPSDGTPNGDSGNGASVDTGSITTTVANAVLVCAGFSWSSTGNFAWDANFTEREDAFGADAIEMADWIVSSTGTRNCTATLSSGSNLQWVAAVVALKASAASSPRHRVNQ